MPQVHCVCVCECMCVYCVCVRVRVRIPCICSCSESVSNFVHWPGEALIHEDGELKMKFKVMTKKGHKQQVGVTRSHVMST